MRIAQAKITGVYAHQDSPRMWTVAVQQCDDATGGEWRRLQADIILGVFRLVSYKTLWHAVIHVLVEAIDASNAQGMVESAVDTYNNREAL